MTTTETVRVDTFATRLVVTNPVGIVVSDQALPAPFADASVQQAIDAAETALLAGAPASLFVKGPTLVDSATALVDSSVTTTETDRQTTQTATQDIKIGPGCIGINDRDVPNTNPCQSCPNAAGEIPPFGEPFCVVSGTTNFNINVNDHTVIQERADDDGDLPHDRDLRAPRRVPRPLRALQSEGQRQRRRSSRPSVPSRSPTRSAAPTTT